MLQITHVQPQWCHMHTTFVILNSLTPHTPSSFLLFNRLATQQLLKTAWTLRLSHDSIVKEKRSASTGAPGGSTTVLLGSATPLSMGPAGQPGRRRGDRPLLRPWAGYLLTGLRWLFLGEELPARGPSPQELSERWQPHGTLLGARPGPTPARPARCPRRRDTGGAARPGTRRAPGCPSTHPRRGGNAAPPLPAEAPLTIRELPVADVLEVRAAAAGIRVPRLGLRRSRAAAARRRRRLVRVRPAIGPRRCPAAAGPAELGAGVRGYAAGDGVAHGARSCPAGPPATRLPGWGGGGGGGGAEAPGGGREGGGGPGLSAASPPHHIITTAASAPTAARAPRLLRAATNGPRASGHRPPGRGVRGGGGGGPAPPRSHPITSRRGAAWRRSANGRGVRHAAGAPPLPGPPPLRSPRAHAAPATAPSAPPPGRGHAIDHAPRAPGSRGPAAHVLHQQQQNTAVIIK